MLWGRLFIVLIGKLFLTQQTKATDLCNTQKINLTDKKASQSSTYSDKGLSYSADRGFDGDKSTCSHTLQQKNSWWTVDLQVVHSISCISIYNVKHHNSDILGAQIYIGNSPEKNSLYNRLVYNITNFQNEQIEKFTFRKSVLGRYVTLMIPENKFMIICEMNITGTEIEPPFCDDW